MRNRILIYEDYGCACLNVLEAALREYYGKRGIEVGVVDAASIIRDNALNKNVLAFVMPGGAATPYRQKLKVQGNQKIADYVSNGGAYLGICAGAYYACSRVEFEKGIPELEIVREEGLLGLVDATAVGTLGKDLGIRPYAGSQASAAAVELVWQNDGERHVAHYHGGPRFELRDPQALILAEYAALGGKPPAIVSKKFGRGRVVLSGVHIEDDGLGLQKAIHALRIDVREASAVAAQLMQNEENRYSLFDKVMRSLER